MESQEGTPTREVARHDMDAGEASSSRPDAESPGIESKSSLTSKFLIGEELGFGAFSKVYKGLDLRNGDFVALKQLPLEGLSEDERDNLVLEIDLLRKLNHKNIVKYYGSYRSKLHLYIILEYVENGSLSQIIKPNKFGAFPESLAAVYMKQILDGLAYLHEQGVIHRDIKGANILTTKEGVVKLADFGVATMSTQRDATKTHSLKGDFSNPVVGTPYWMAPEVIEMSGVTFSSDIWSVGCTAIELLTGKPPYFDMMPLSALFHIVQDDYPPMPEGISAEMKDFLLKCFQKKPDRRPAAAELLTHDWFQKFKASWDVPDQPNGNGRFNARRFSGEGSRGGGSTRPPAKEEGPSDEGATLAGSTSSGRGSRSGTAGCESACGSKDGRHLRALLSLAKLSLLSTHLNASRMSSSAKASWIDLTSRARV